MRMTGRQRRALLAQLGHKSAHPRNPKRGKCHERLMKESRERGFAKISELWWRAGIVV